MFFNDLTPLIFSLAMMNAVIGLPKFRSWSSVETDNAFKCHRPEAQEALEIWTRTMNWLAWGSIAAACEQAAA
jgi:hypothetical protein